MVAFAKPQSISYNLLSYDLQCYDLLSHDAYSYDISVVTSRFAAIHELWLRRPLRQTYN